MRHFYQEHFGHKSQKTSRFSPFDHLRWFQVLLRVKCYEGPSVSHTVGKWVSKLTLTSGPFGIGQGAQTDPSNILHATVDMSTGRIMYLCWPGIPNTYQLFTHTCTLEPEITAHTRYQYVQVLYNNHTHRCAPADRRVSCITPTPHYFRLFLRSEDFALLHYV